MADLTQGITKKREVTEQLDLPASSNLKQEIKITKDRDFHVNYVILDCLFQGATDEPTEAEKLAKLGTMSIDTKSTGKWKSEIDFDDLYYRNLARLGKQNSYLIGDGGGDDDFHGMRIILDAGLGRKINSKCAWDKDSDAVLKLNLGADSGLDNARIDYTVVGYEGKRPDRVLAVENREETPSTAGDLSKFEVVAGDVLQEYFAFLTTELNLATIQATNSFGIRKLSIRPNDQVQNEDILAYVNQMVDGIDDGGEGLLQQYVRKSFDTEFQGFGRGLNKDDKIVVEYGVAEATRHYLSYLQRV